MGVRGPKQRSTVRDAGMLVLAAGLVWACGLNVEGSEPPAASAGMGAQGGSASGGAAGQWGTGGSAGVSSGGAGVGGSAGVATGGAPGTGGTSGAAGTGGGGGSAGVPPDSCGNLCIGSNSKCDKGQCKCNAGYANTDNDGDDRTATCRATVSSLTVTVGIDHTFLGHLTIKLKSPSGTLLTLMSRPGANEAADDGAGNEEGDGSDLAAAFPITFGDGASVSAENMGGFLSAVGATVCRDAETDMGGSGLKICNYKPDRGKASPPDSFDQAFKGEIKNGAWTLCAGDSFPAREGSLQSVVLDFVTAAGPETANRLGIALMIPDDGYNGSEASMACASIDVNGA